MYETQSLESSPWLELVSGSVNLGMSDCVIPFLGWEALIQRGEGV